MSDKYETKNNKGSLFRADEKPKETSPDYKGEIRVDGQLYWLSAWVNTAKSGKKYFALSVQPKEEQGQKKGADGAPPADDFIDDDVPF